MQSLPNQIIVSIKNIDGKDVIVPMCPKAVSFAAIAGTSTLDKKTVQHIQAIGFAVKIKQDVKTLHNVFA